MTTPDCRRIAIQAVDLLCSVGCYGLDPSKQRQLWQRALDLDRELHPHRVASIVWTETEGDIDPPRRADGTPVPTVSADGRGLVAATATEAAIGDGHAEHKHEFPPGIYGSCECGKSYTAAQVDEALSKYVTERAGSFVTASMVQRRVRVGYAKAAGLLDALAETGVVMPPDGKGRYAVPFVTHAATETARETQ